MFQPMRAQPMLPNAYQRPYGAPQAIPYAMTPMASGQAIAPQAAGPSVSGVFSSLGQMLTNIWNFIKNLFGGKTSTSAPQAMMPAVPPAVYAPAVPAQVAGPTPVLPPTPVPPPPPPPAPPAPPPPTAATPATATPTLAGPAAPAKALKGPFLNLSDYAQQYNLYGATSGLWFGNGAESRQDIEKALRDGAARNETPVLVQYNIPNRDVGGPSSGGAQTKEAYLKDVANTASFIGNASAVMVLEPDALASSLDPATLKAAVEIYKGQCPNLKVYIDAGHPAWASVDDITNKLLQAGIEKADGFALNTSAFQWTNDNLAYGDKIVAALAARNPALADKQFVIDTSRNGNGPGVDDQGKWTWGDPVRAQNGGPIMNGPLPTTNTGDSHCAAFLWVKGPGGGDNRTRPAAQFGGADWVQPTKQPRLGPGA